MTTKWEVWTYDVWGNPEDGYDVNDRSCACRDYEIESDDGQPTDVQIRECFETYFGLGGEGIETGGSDTTVYVGRARDGYPIGEMIRITE